MLVCKSKNLEVGLNENNDRKNHSSCNKMVENKFL
jgi:hypothetical protein